MLDVAPGVRFLKPPAGMGDCVSRREAATLLGFRSEFKVRQLEKAGRLRAERGPMGSAWYPRAQVLAIRQGLAPGPTPAARGDTGAPAPRGRVSDAALIQYLRGAGTTTPAGDHAPTVVDLVADTGIAIARAEKVYRFWLTEDRHPSADAARAARGGRGAGSVVAPRAASARRALSDEAAAEITRHADDEAAATESGSPGSRSDAGTATERRGDARLERDHLIGELRHPDPAVRAAAFLRLRPGRARRR